LTEQWFSPNLACTTLNWTQQLQNKDKLIYLTQKPPAILAVNVIHPESCCSWSICTEFPDLWNAHSPCTTFTSTRLLDFWNAHTSLFWSWKGSLAIVAVYSFWEIVKFHKFVNQEAEMVTDTKANQKATGIAKQSH